MIHQAVPSGRGLISNGFIFQYNSDPKHTANAVKAWIENHADMNSSAESQRWDYWDNLDRKMNLQEAFNSFWRLLKEIPREFRLC